MPLEAAPQRGRCGERYLPGQILLTFAELAGGQRRRREGFMRVCQIAVLAFSASALVRGHAASPAPLFVVHSTARNCSSITQLDSALASNYQGFFKGWSEQDYRDAIAWSQACSDYGWHLPGRSRIPMLQAQHDKALGPSPAQVDAPPDRALQRPRMTIDSTEQPPVRAALKLPADGSPMIGSDTTVLSHYQDTLFDIARRYGLGYEEIVRANPGVDIWMPGEGMHVLLPKRRILPPGSREGIVVNLPEHRLYYFPKPAKNEAPTVFIYPVSIGKDGDATPLGQTRILEKTEHPSWVPTKTIRNEHAALGDPLPRVVGPGPDNPIGDYKMRLGFGDGTYEIHGTNKPFSVGMAATYGCIGMYPEDLAALYKMVSVGTPVRLINVPVKVAWTAGTLAIEAHPVMDAHGQTTAPNLGQLADVLHGSAQDSKVSIQWERAMYVLEQADGVVATVGTRL
jgi:L,D-transpeptidase ErfK/SrfK